MKLFGYCLGLMLLLLPVLPVAQTVVKTDVVKTDSEKLTGLDSTIEQLMKDWNVPGLAISIVKEDKIIYSKGYGYRDVKKELPVTPETLFAIGSCTKAFTATGLGILVDEGRLQWDKPIRGYLPEFKLHDEYVAGKITASDLLTHRSGLPRHDGMWYGSPFSRQELLARLQYLEPNAGFRELFQYNNLMFMVAGCLTEAITKQSWEEFVQTRLLNPLGMKNSNFSVSLLPKANDYALPYAEQKGEVRGVPFRNIDAIGPAGAINSNVVEMSNWVMFNLAKGKWNNQQLVSESAMTQIHSPQIVMPGGAVTGEFFYACYGMGWLVTAYRSHLRLEHSGGIDGFTALVSLLPRQKCGIVILANLTGAPIHTTITNIVYDRLLSLEAITWQDRLGKLKAQMKTVEESKAKEDLQRLPNTQPAHPLKDYTGKFEHPAYGLLKIEEVGGKLQASFHGFISPLRHYHYDIFEAEDDVLSKNKLCFLTNVKGEVDKVTSLFEPSVKELVFERVVEKKSLDKAALYKFTGDYEIAGSIIKISLRGDNLILAVPGQPEYELVAIKEYEFNFKTLTGYSVVFQCDEAGKVTQVAFHQPNGVFAAKKK